MLKKCPYCAEDIQAEARKCKHCGEFLDREPAGAAAAPPASFAQPSPAGAAAYATAPPAPPAAAPIAPASAADALSDEAIRKKLRNYNFMSFAVGLPGAVLWGVGMLAPANTPAKGLMYGIGILMLGIAFALIAHMKGRSLIWGVFGLFGILGLFVLAMIGKSCRRCGAIASYKINRCPQCGAPI